MAPGQSGVEIFAGYLYKKTRSVFSGWQRRYFVLLKEHGSGSATLKYWHTDKSYRDRPEEARGEISMRVNPGEAIARRVTASQPTMHMRLPGRILEFRSKDDDQIAQWLQAFSKLTDEAAQARGKAVSQQSKATSKDAVSDRIAESSEYDVFSRPIGTKTPSLLPPAPNYSANERGSSQKSTSDPIPQRDLVGSFTAVKSNGEVNEGVHRPRTPPGVPRSPSVRSPSVQGSRSTAQAEERAPAPSTPRNTPPVPASVVLPATPPPPPPRQVGSTPRGQPPSTPRGQSSGAAFSPRAGWTSSAVSYSELLTPRSRAPPVPMLSIDFQHMREPKSAQEIQTVDGTIYFRAATRVSPRNYKSFTARKFLQPDISSDESEGDGDDGTEGGKADSGGEDDQDGSLLTDDDLLDLFMKKQKRIAEEGTVTDRDKSSKDKVLTTIATPRGPTATSQQGRKAVVDAEPLSSQARALLSPRLPQGRNDIYPRQTQPMSQSIVT